VDPDWSGFHWVSAADLKAKIGQKIETKMKTFYVLNDQDILSGGLQTSSGTSWRTLKKYTILI
jgi:hypothetical protein